jgi:hypothetical protein
MKAGRLLPKYRKRMALIEQGARFSRHIRLSCVTTKHFGAWVEFAGAC